MASYPTPDAHPPPPDRPPVMGAAPPMRPPTPTTGSSGGRVVAVLGIVLCLVPALLLVVVIVVGSIIGSSAENNIRTGADRAAASVGPVDLIGDKDLGGNLLCLDSCKAIHRTYRLHQPTKLSDVRRSLETWYASQSSIGGIGKVWCDRSGGTGCPEVVLYKPAPRDFVSVATLRVCPDDAVAVAGNRADIPDRDVRICELTIEET